MLMTGAQAMIKALELEGVTTLFGYPGAAICPFYDALLDSPIEHVLTRNEQGAAHAASGYARAAGCTGVCVATSGPGSTNLITGIATAYMDSVPLVVITGQVMSDLLGHDSFQEADTTGATSPFTKHNYLVKSAKELPRIFREAFFIASTGRPGPVVIDVPQDIQTEQIDFVYPEGVSLPGYRPEAAMSGAEAEQVIELLSQSGSPVICAGGGVISSHADQDLRRFAEKFGIPVVTTLMGVGSLPADHPANLGILGSHGVFTANYALHHADLVIIVGARIGNRAMGSATEIAKRARIVHIDIDPAEIGKNIRPHLPIISDALHALRLLASCSPPKHYDEWLARIRETRLQHTRLIRPSGLDRQTIFPPALLAQLAQLAGPDAIITTEVGQNQIWAANHYPIMKSGTFLSSGGMGTMGYGLPAAVGAKVACPGRTVILIGGDGSLQMSVQELGTIRQNRLGVKIVLFNNQRLGMVHEMQQQKYQGRYSQVFLECNPNFGLLAAAYGFSYRKVDTDADGLPALKAMLADDEPWLLECTVHPDEPTLYKTGPERIAP